MKNETIFYYYSLDSARHMNEVDVWKESHKANVECKEFIKNELYNSFEDGLLDGNCGKRIIKEFGYDRTFHILRTTVRFAIGDLRYSEDNRTWSYDTSVAESNFKKDYILSNHPCLVNALINQVRAEYESLNLYGNACVNEHIKDYTGKILIISPESLGEKFRKPQNQLFYATGGFGCSPDTIGRTIYGYFLIDGEYARFQRDDFLGVIDNRFLPEWAKYSYLKLTEEKRKQKNN